MNKSKLFVLTALSALLMILLCACNTDVPPVGETQPDSSDASVTAGIADTKADVSDADESTVLTEDTTSVKDEELPSQGESDLEIITVPRDTSEAPQKSESTEAVTQAVAEITDAENNTTEVQKIELPFVPAN